MADLAEHNYHEHSGGASRQGFDTVPATQMATIQGYDKQQKHDHISSPQVTRTARLQRRCNLDTAAVPREGPHIGKA